MIFRIFCNFLRIFCFLLIPLIMNFLASGLLADSGALTLYPLADGYTKKDSPNSSFGAENGIWVQKTSTASSSGDQNGYLRFGTTPFTNSSTWIEQASLVLDATSFPGSGTTYFSFDLYGMPDGHPDESFGETTLTFSNAVNSSANLPGSFNTNGLVYLGSAKAVSTNVPQAIGWNGPALRDFIRANQNSHLSFVLVRSNANSSATADIGRT